MKEDQKLDINKLKKLYNQKVNVLDYLRKKKKKNYNDEQEIRLSYELQAGVYIKEISNKNFAKKNIKFCKEFSEVFDKLGCNSILHAGVGDAKSLTTILKLMKSSPSLVYGFDISLSRLIYAKKFLESNGFPKSDLFLSSATKLPLPDNSFEIVFTIETIEANIGKELEIIKELLRVTGKYLVLNEPIYDFKNKNICEHIEKNAYSKSLENIIKKLNVCIIDSFIMSNPLNKKNKTSIIIIKKTNNFSQKKIKYLSPNKKSILKKYGDLLYSEKEGLVFPSIYGVRCLEVSNAIMSLRFKEATKYFNEN